MRRGDDGIATLIAKMTVLEGAECDAILAELAGTVCAADPRTRKQLRGYALLALCHREESVVCMCGSERCPVAAAAQFTPPRRQNLLNIHIDIDTLLGLSNNPATLSDGTVLDPEIARLLATDARWQVLLTDMLDAARAHKNPDNAGTDTNNSDSDSDTETETETENNSATATATATTRCGDTHGGSDDSGASQREVDSAAPGGAADPDPDVEPDPETGSPGDAADNGTESQAFQSILRSTTQKQVRPRIEMTTRTIRMTTPTEQTTATTTLSIVRVPEGARTVRRTPAQTRTAQTRAARTRTVQTRGVRGRFLVRGV